MTDDLTAAFKPDWVSPPGESVLDIAEERGWTQVELAQRLGYSEKHISQFINGKVPLSVEAAMRLERVVGSTAAFWLAREADYQRHLARLESARCFTAVADFKAQVRAEVVDSNPCDCIRRRPYKYG
jgi:HTH-type transcriptional regulator / antitoxin HigA